MALLRLPHSARSRKAPTFAQVVRRVHPDRIGCKVFEGPYFKTGSTVDSCDLCLDGDESPPLVLLEVAGPDGTGHGHNRSNVVRILWRFSVERWDWIEVCRSLSRSADWIPDMAAIAQRLLGGPPPPDPERSNRAAFSLLRSIDTELAELALADRHTALNLLHEQILARLVA